MKARDTCIAIVCIVIAACGSEETKQDGNSSPERRSVVPTDNRSSIEERVAAFNARFRHYRNGPHLMRGKVLADAEVTTIPRVAIDKRNSASLAYAAGRGDEADPAGFIFRYREGPGPIQGGVDYLISQENTSERIYVLKKPILVGPGGKSEPYPLSDKEVAQIADLFATMMGPDAYNREVPTFAVYDGAANR